MNSIDATDEMPPRQLEIGLASAIAEVGRNEWQACAALAGPFLSHAYLSAAEESGLVAPGSGWVPLHMVVRDQRRNVVAVAPTYLKGNSNDEYWTDKSWAIGYDAAGGRYFPKLLIGVPFAPVTGQRFLEHPDAPPGMAEAMIRFAETMARANGLSSIHVTFPDEIDRRRLEAAGWLVRFDIQFEWRNRGYRDFVDFLDALTSRNRQRIKRERRIVAKSGLRIRDVQGDRLQMADTLAFISLLDRLHAMRSTRQPLTAAFIAQLAAGLGDQLTLSFAEEDGHPVAALLSITGTDRIHVRNWGCLPDLRFLHFECCYYRLIEKAIALGCDAVEGGYGGVHKLARGFQPKLTCAAHWFRDDGLRKAVAEQDVRGNEAVLAALAGYEAHSPFRDGSA